MVLFHRIQSREVRGQTRCSVYTCLRMQSVFGLRHCVTWTLSYPNCCACICWFTRGNSFKSLLHAATATKNTAATKKKYNRYKNICSGSLGKQNKRYIPRLNLSASGEVFVFSSPRLCSLHTFIIIIPDSRFFFPHS